MPAITLGLAEIEERVQVLRRRLNTVTLLHAAFVTLSTGFLVAAALVAVGARADPSAFRTIRWSALVLVASIGGGCVVAARRRWLDEPATAALADQRGQLTDRLTTLVDLRRRPRPSRLAPLLIAQTLALGENWRPQRIAPRRVPRSAFAALLSLLIFSASPLVAPEPPAPTAQRTKQQPATLNGMDDGLAPAPSLIGNAGPGEEIAGANSLPPSGELPASQAGEDSTTSPQPPLPHSGADRLSGLRPDPLHKAVPSAVGAEQTDRGRELGSEPQPPGNETTTQPSERTTGAADDRVGAPHDGTARRRPAESGRTAPEPAAGDTRAQPRPNQANAKDQPQEPQDTSGEQSPSGSAPNAGSGSRPENLLGPGTAAVAAGQGGTTTFKLTITSFLHAADEQAQQPQPTDRRSGSVAAVAADAAIPALNDQQLRDDALRKAEIPPEYEDIVRRVYFSRATDVRNALPVSPAVVGVVASDSPGSAALKGREAPPAAP